VDPQEQPDYLKRIAKLSGELIREKLEQPDSRSQVTWTHDSSDDKRRNHTDYDPHHH